MNKIILLLLLLPINLQAYDAFLHQTIIERASKESLRFEGVAEQGFDKSCGIASFLTIARIYWGMPELSEDSVLEKFASTSDNGFISLDVISNIAEDNGFETIAYKMDWDEINEALNTYKPAIVHYKWPDLHFAAILGIEDNLVILADPARGVEAISKSEFLKRWSGNTLFLLSRYKTLETEKLEESVLKKMRKIHLLNYHSRSVS